MSKLFFVTIYMQKNIIVAVEAHYGGEKAFFLATINVKIDRFD